MDGTHLIDELLTPAGSANPYPLYVRLRELGTLTSAWEDSTLLAVRHRTVHQLLRDPGFGVADSEIREELDPEQVQHSSRRMLARSILEVNAPHHARMRSLISSVFTARRVAALEPAVVATIRRLLDETAELGSGGSTLDFMDTFAFRLPVSVICELLGVPEQDRYLFRALAADLTIALEMIADADELLTADAATDQLAAYFTELAAQRRAHPKDDLVSALVQVADAADSRLTDEELLANLILLLVAGFETTTNLLGNGLALAFQHPWTANGLRTGRVTPAGFTDEVLRYDSPVQLTSRLPMTDGLSVEGRPVPLGTGVFLLLGAANRDPERYPDPEVFDPTRTESQPLSFGGGPHFCLGAQLARLEANLALPALLGRFPAIAPAGEAVRRERLVLRGYQSFPITVG
ncbi:cytochrome P450 [Kitasatospora sp. MAP12-15]|uniref:cytochrome P450 n=1 Tax=unclassified Kitasatospora TaxID=2633591 RepID=UPI0024765669|nr:cytochrome P450 [Kitasatospora sp. MAP12-44]MDH6110126.1 cytochrome P450 [Kitasatospora sp. MAP12-44]